MSKWTRAPGAAITEGLSCSPAREGCSLESEPFCVPPSRVGASKRSVENQRRTQRLAPFRAPACFSAVPASSPLQRRWGPVGLPAVLRVTATDIG